MGWLIVIIKLKRSIRVIEIVLEFRHKTFDLWDWAFYLCPKIKREEVSYLDKAAILVDEINAVSQFHNIGIEGINPWLSFYETTEMLITEKHHVTEVEYHLYGAAVPKTIDPERYYLRKRFFKSLLRDGINVHKAYCLPNAQTKRLEEKGVDMLIGLDIFQKAQKGYKYIYLFSGDADLVPAIQRAQKLGSKVIAILSKNQPATMIRRYANKVMDLEVLIESIPPETIVLRKEVVV